MAFKCGREISRNQCSSGWVENSRANMCSYMQFVHTADEPMGNHKASWKEIRYGDVTDDLKPIRFHPRRTTAEDNSYKSFLMPRLYLALPEQEQAQAEVLSTACFCRFPDNQVRNSTAANREILIKL